MADRYRPICATIYNYVELTFLEDWYNAKCTYLVYGEETCPDTGRQHLQVYFELKNAMSFAAIQKKFCHCHCEQRLGTPKQAAGYCKKGEDFILPKQKDLIQSDIWFPRNPGDTDPYVNEKDAPWIGKEFGTISHQGERTELINLTADLTAGQPIRYIVENHTNTYIKFHKGIEKVRSYMIKPRNLEERPQVIVRWGPTNTGKSESARLKDWPDIPHWVWDPASKHWFDGYDGEDKIIIEEFRSHIPFRELLTLLDRYECKREFKGGMINVVASKFIITSPTHPSTWYSNLSTQEGNLDQLLKSRITQVIEHYPRHDISQYCL